MFSMHLNLSSTPLILDLTCIDCGGRLEDAGEIGKVLALIAGHFLLSTMDELAPLVERAP
jgi:hypothetical protein